MNQPTNQPTPAKIRILAGRLQLQHMRHPLLVGLNLFAAGAMALGIGAIYWDTGVDTGGIQDRFGSLFFMTMYLSLASLSSLPVRACVCACMCTP